MFKDGQEGEVTELKIKEYTPEYMFFFNMCYILSNFYPTEVELCLPNSLQLNVA